MIRHSREQDFQHLLCLALALHECQFQNLLEKRGHRTEIRNRSQGNVWLVDNSKRGLNLFYKTISYKTDRIMRWSRFFSRFGPSIREFSSIGLKAVGRNRTQSCNRQMTQFE